MHSGSEAQDKPIDGLEQGEVIASRYVVNEIWRKHPLGELYRCIDEANDRPVLLQRLRREFAEPGVADRLFDTRGRAALGSALIPDILDYGTDFDGRPFLVSRTYDARSLAELERPIAFEEAVEIVSSIANALIPAHDERLVHGGIEPSSVLIEREADGRPRVVALLGFGLVPALEAGGERSKTLPLLMAPTHVAPELIRGAPMSPAADVYALGILLWELIYGTPPFRGPTLRVIDAHLSRALPELELPFDVPPAFDWVLRRMLGKNPVDRFVHAEAVVEQLRQFFDDAIPDLTFALDPESPPVLAAASVPRVSPKLPKPTPRERGEDEERTSIFDRRVPEPVATRSPASIVVEEERTTIFDRSVPEPVPLRSSPAPVVEEEKTSIFDRGGPDPTPHNPFASLPPAALILDNDDDPLVVPRPSRAKWLAVAMGIVVLALVGVQAMINARIDAAAAEHPADPAP